MERLRAIGQSCFVLLILLTLPAAAQAQTGPSEPEASRFQKVLLEGTGLDQPVRLSIAPDGRVIFAQIDGAVKIWRPQTASTVTAGKVPVARVGELGLIGLTLAPDFASSGHIYVNYAPPNYLQTCLTRVSRFSLGDDNALDLSSEVKILEISHDECYIGHQAGDLEMTPDGLLFITTGDNSNCCASLGYAPHDERPGQRMADSQRTSSNSNNLNGKLLRIRPLPEGGYSIPEGNMFPEVLDTGGKTRPEIYAMGLRNPFAMGDYDPATGALWIADYGADAAVDGPRGPRQYVRGLLVTEPAFYGWPYCTANNLPYTNWDYVADAGRGPFDCARPVNDSPNNTGLVNLPPAKPANLYWSYAPSDPWPTLYGGGAHAGPMYHFDPDNPSATKFPQWFDGRRFVFDFTASWVASTRFAADMATPEDVRQFLPGTWDGVPMDMRFGPDGSLYVIEFGANNYGSAGGEAGIYRIDYVSGNRSPLVKASADPDSGRHPLTVNFDASQSSDPDGDALTYAWDFNSDGRVDATGPKPAFEFREPGQYAPRVTVTDAHGASAIENLSIVVGNSRPVVTFETPTDGTFREFGQPIPFKVKVVDADGGGPVDCTRVVVSYSLGHDRHAHHQSNVTADANCEGVLVPQPDGAHSPGGFSTAYLYHVLTASYTDEGGAGGTPSLQGSATAVLHPRSYQAAAAQKRSGVAQTFLWLNMSATGSYLMFPRVNLKDVDRINFEIGSSEAGATYTVRADSPTGPIVAQKTNLPDTGTQWWIFYSVFQWFSAPVTDPGGVHDLYLVVDYPPGTEPAAVTLQDFEFITDPAALTATVEPVAPNGSAGWYNTPVTVKVDAGDAPLWTRQTSRDNGQTWQNTNGQGAATISANGTNTVLYRAIDSAGATAPGGSLTFKLDTAPPVTTAALSPAEPAANGWYSAPPEITLSATDATSGVEAIEYRVDGGEWKPYGGPFKAGGFGAHVVSYRSKDQAGNVEASRDVTFQLASASQTAPVGGTVATTLSLSLGTPASFGAFAPGVAKTYEASTTATVVSSAGDATFSVADPSSTATGHLVNGAFSLPKPLQARARNAATTDTAYGNVGSSAAPLNLLTYGGPVANDAVALQFSQRVNSTDALRTGTYSKTLTLTLSTTAP